MYFSMKNYLKNNRNYTDKHARNNVKRMLDLLEPVRSITY